MSHRALLGALLAILASAPAFAEAPSSERGDRYTLVAHSETHAQLFRRALLPGANGTRISTETALPISEYVVLSARDIDTPWQRDSVDLELSLWGRLGLYDLAGQRAFDGDVQSANVRQRVGRFSLRLGRQQVAGGAARYSRFDGIDAEVELGAGFFAEAYTGFTVMPRWNERPSYLYLGSASDSGLRGLAQTPAAARESLWLAGARFGIRRTRADAVVSFQEQHEALGSSHRNLGASARWFASEHATLGANAILELSSNRFADAALYIDYALSRAIDASLEYFHTEPALLLSRQSVLSVFSADGYEEAGGSLRIHPSSRITLQALAFLNAYSDGESGARNELSATAWLDARRSSFMRLSYARVQAPDNGYHSLRAALLRHFGTRVSGTLESYHYIYERPIRGFRTAAVYSATLSYRPLPSVSVLGGATLARTPDASVDAQGQLRVSCDFDFVRRGRGL